MIFGKDTGYEPCDVIAAVGTCRQHPRLHSSDGLKLRLLIILPCSGQTFARAGDGKMSTRLGTRLGDLFYTVGMVIAIAVIGSGLFIAKGPGGGDGDRLHVATACVALVAVACER
jgi:hypothetical protein